MSKSIKAGDVVQLKSGGPNMTVVKKSPDDQDYLDCIWFGYNQVLEERSFLPATLRVVSDKPPLTETQTHILMQLHDKGVISTKTLLEGNELDYDQEVKFLQRK